MLAAKLCFSWILRGFRTLFCIGYYIALLFLALFLAAIAIKIELYKYEKALARFSVERALYIRYTVLSMIHFTDGGTLASEGGRGRVEDNATTGRVEDIATTVQLLVRRGEGQVEALLSWEQWCGIFFQCVG